MSRKFQLTLTVEGSSLEEIDHELMQAAGERIRARMVNPPAGPLGVPSFATPAPTVAREEPLQANSNAGASVNEPPREAAVLGFPGTDGAADAGATGKKRGVKPGTKRGSYKKDGEKNEQEENEETEESVPASDGAGNQAVSESAPAHPTGAPAVHAAPSAPVATIAGAKKPATLLEAVEALKLVNLTHNADKARECLSHFNVQRCGQLTDENRQSFIDYCRTECGQ